MSSIDITSNNNKEAVINVLKSNIRFDGRSLLSERTFDIKFGEIPGCIQFYYGKTSVAARVTGRIIEPRKERQNEGQLRFHVNIQSANNTQQSIPNQKPQKHVLEINKYLERVIKGSRAIDVESLVILSGKFVWCIDVDLELINNDGNIIDTCYFAAIFALINFKRPFTTIEPGYKLKIHHESQKKAQLLSIAHIPLSFTFCFFTNSQLLVLDPLRCEEEIMEGRISIAMNVYKDICTIHKPGGASIQKDILFQLIEVCSTKVKPMTQRLRDLLALQPKQEQQIDFGLTNLIMMVKDSDLQALGYFPEEQNKIQDNLQNENNMEYEDEDNIQEQHNPRNQGNNTQQQDDIEIEIDDNQEI